MIDIIVDCIKKYHNGEFKSIFIYYNNDKDITVTFNKDNNHFSFNTKFIEPFMIEEYFKIANDELNKL